jgi:hypothetical protein
MIGVSLVGGVTELDARHSKCACAIGMGAAKRENALRLNHPIVPNAGCSVRFMLASIIAVGIILRG